MPSKPAATRSRSKIEADLREAQSYAEWLALAGEHDRVTGADDWRADDHTDLLHVPEIRKSILRLREMREAGETWGLRAKLQEVLFRHQSEFTHPELYHTAKAGTKFVVTEFLDEVEACAGQLLSLDVEGADDAFKLEELKRVGRVYGRPALLLSGGGALGIFHLGVVKALFEQDLLPRSISGSSMGSIIAAWACTHNDDEIRAQLANPQSIFLDALRVLPFREMLAQRTIMDQPHLLKFLQTLTPEMTFAESMQHSRRILNISVCPYNTVQSPRLLNYLSAPDTMIHNASVASCAIPGAFKPVQLLARQQGQVVPWMEGELWVDGSVGNDLPFAQLAQLLNINHFITSQANPHIVPFQAVSGDNRSHFSALTRMYGGIAFDSWSQVLNAARKRQPNGLMRGLLATAHGVVSQRYASSDMHIQLPFKLGLFPKVLQNPSFEDLLEYIRLGERATWPQIPMIQDRTRLSRWFGNNIGTLLQRLSAATPRGKTGKASTR
jgi:TAG lipase/steryl ester hydrolase/phospholipase A2/LPA acyltransferase